MHKITSCKICRFICIILFVSSLFLIYGCLKKGAIQTDVTGIDAQNLEQVVENNNDIDELETLKQQLAEVNLKYQKVIEAGTINYGGATTVVIGMSIVMVIFLVAGGFWIKRGYNKAAKNEQLIDLLSLSIFKAPPSTQKEIKQSIESTVATSDFFTDKTKKELRTFVENKGWFAKGK